jgi:hypothetical protein
MAAAARGRRLKLETRIKISNARQGAAPTPETRERMALARRRWWAEKKGEAWEEEEEEGEGEGDTPSSLSLSAARAEAAALRAQVSGWVAAFTAAAGRPPSRADAAGAAPATRDAFLRWVALRDYVEGRGEKL